MILQARSILLLVCVGSSLSAVLPVQDPQMLYLAGVYPSASLRLRRAASPTRAIMYTGYFSAPRGYHYNPNFQPRTYEPQGAMTAFAAGNTVATRHYYGNEYQPTNVQPNCGTCLPNSQDVPQAQPDSTGVTLPPLDVATPPQPQPQLPVTILSDAAATELPADTPEETPESAPLPPAEAPAPDAPQLPEAPQAPEKGDDDVSKSAQEPEKPGRAKAPKYPTKRPDDEEEYDEEDEQPFHPSKGRNPGKHYNSYFPIYFGLPGYGGRGQGEGGPLNPGVATAIANSYSNGRGAVATSHATAYGGPNFGNGAKKGSKGRTPQ
ncbi:uncharacterized protein LOC134529467 [Bacillus rossius redtenbacheri]|uniref:uncharacterized protein LOC134529467 n=1 Tax=Bacillus rossius redtenbacheri TaxID=93214 RepID=UPI002FDE5ED1